MPSSDECVITFRVVGGIFGVGRRATKLNELLKQRPNWLLARRSMDRLQTYCNPDKIPHRSGWRLRHAYPCH
jgi:hypothetical protein